MTRTSHELCNPYRGVEFLSDRTLKRFFKRSDVEIDSGKGSSLYGSGVGGTGYSHFISFHFVAKNEVSLDRLVSYHIYK